MRGRYLHSDSPSARRAEAVVYAVATGASVFYWTVVGAGWPALHAGKIIDALFLLIPATMIWWLVAGVGLRVVGRVDVSRSDASPAGVGSRSRSGSRGSPAGPSLTAQPP